MFKRAPLVSILIPAYNAAYFEQALASAAGQDFQDTEIVVCDDSAGQDIAQACRRFQDKRLVYLRNASNLGFAGNFTQCFHAARGRYVKFLNDDDLLMPACVGRMVECFEAGGQRLALVTSRRQVIDENGRRQPDINATVPLAHLDCRIAGLRLGDFLLTHSVNFVGEPSSVLFRRRDVRIAGRSLFWLNGTDYECLADMSLWLRLLARGDAAYIAEPLSLFRVHAGQEQAKPGVALKCLTERYSVIGDAVALGFLRAPGAYAEAMGTVAGIFQAALSDAGLNEQMRRTLEELKARIPAEFQPTC